MTGTFEGDLVRPLGPVTLNAAYAEGEIDDLISALPAREPFDDSRRRWPVGQKLLYAQKLVAALEANELSGLLATLDEARDLFDQRNELIHGRLFAGGRLVSNQSNVQVRRISEQDIVGLADRMSDWKERLWMHRCRYLLPLLATRRAQDDA